MAGKACNRTDLIAYASYEFDRLCFILVPLRGKINLGPRPQKKILVPFRGHFQKIRRTPPSLLYGSPPRDVGKCLFDIRSEKHWLLLKYSTSSDRPQLVGSSIKDENKHDVMVAVEGTTDEDDKYFTEEEEIL